MGTTSTAAKLRKKIDAAYAAMSSHRDTREAHIDKYVGRWHTDGVEKLRESGTQIPDAPLNLLGQAIDAYVGALVPIDPVFDIAPTRSEMEFAAKVLKLTLDDAMADMNAAQDIYRPAVGDALVSPLTAFYTGRRESGQVISAGNSEVDPGDTFIQHVPFDAYVVDHSVSTLRARNWEGHYFEANRAWLLSNEAYRDHWDTIKNLDSARVSGNQDRGRKDNDGDSEADEETIELLNVVSYEGGRVIERVMTASGKEVILREIDYTDAGPDNGPYDRLFFYPAMGRFWPTSPASKWRDACAMGDLTFGKMAAQMMASKSLLVGPDATKALEAAKTAGDLTAIDAEQGAFEVKKLEFVLASILPVVTMMMDQANAATNNPKFLRGIEGGGKGAETARGMGMLAAQSQSMVNDLFSNVAHVMAEHGRKMAHWKLTDPLLNIQRAMPGGKGMMMRLTAETLGGGLKDFRFKVLPRMMQASDPAVRMQRLGEMLNALERLMPFIQAGIFQLTPTLRLLQREYGVADVDSIIGVPELAQQGMMAQQLADLIGQRGGMPGGISSLQNIRGLQPLGGLGNIGPTTQEIPQAAPRQSAPVPLAQGGTMPIQMGA